MSMEHEGDCQRIADVILQKRNRHISLECARKLWDDHSESRAAGWLIIHEDDEIIEVFDYHARKESNAAFDKWWREYSYGQSGELEWNVNIHDVAQDAFEAGFKKGQRS